MREYGVPRYKVSRRRIPRRLIPCACGCGEMVETPDKYGRPRRYIFNHHLSVQGRGIYPKHLEESNLKKRIPHSSVEGIEGKVCRICRKWLPLQEYGKDKGTWDGLERRCKICNSARSLYYHYRHKDRINAYRRTEKYRKRFRVYQAQWSRDRRRNDPNYRMRRRLRHRIWKALKGKRKHTTTMELLGCTIEELRAHLENQFDLGMSWNNYGQPGWEIDHVVPCAAFNLTDPEQQKVCFHYTNLQPLWGPDNWAKSSKILMEGGEECVSVW